MENQELSWEQFEKLPWQAQRELVGLSLKLVLLKMHGDIEGAKTCAEEIMQIETLARSYTGPQNG